MALPRSRLRASIETRDPKEDSHWVSEIAWVGKRPIRWRAATFRQTRWVAMASEVLETSAGGQPIHGGYRGFIVAMKHDSNLAATQRSSIVLCFWVSSFYVFCLFGLFSSVSRTGVPMLMNGRIDKHSIVCSLNCKPIGVPSNQLYLFANEYALKRWACCVFIDVFSLVLQKTIVKSAAIKNDR